MWNVKKWAFNFLLILCVACAQKHAGNLLHGSSNKYASGFEIKDYISFKKIVIKNPWEQASGVSFDYYLFKKGQKVPDSLKNKKIIFTPVDRVACLSTSHIAFLDALGEADKITAISGGRYINNPEIREKLALGEIADVGYDQGLNYELLLKQKPDLIFVYGIGSEITGFVRKMEDMGLNVFFVAEYLEETPLGKAEWIKCLAPLFEKEKEAALFFKKVEDNYNTLRKKAENAGSRPNVLVGLPYRDSWWVPGGDSYLSELIKDAGGNYIGEKNRSHESYVISFENAVIWSAKANVWINVGSVSSKSEILAVDERFKNFPAFRNARIYNNNKRMSPQGGNDFWESGTVHPDLILKDLIQIFHPGLLEKSDLIYYREIK